ncbi:hypothetical protein AJ85_09380 [Alkalihalobacillus alcalophilus ATCC 27647 = CGMCC 1.3604]|uniref:Cyclic-di-AMP phosphodiesterase n=1 Tax=Alkalihalobacillus alcalophilus ATCC 27647 = CGMCC 1.3604 TaxID=1218173 RepID=A0A094WES6_ALKAL|nr:DHH family phosphoesterase [Alkalihalobacillus alcalophilus]KGA96229.1 hypothetical protein BALCAV_0217450 [Alkalihalobacillus alcalophilus ATCC 27647 = CGMCC 1.3604]MED1560734.1 DHH family phosphoesterase [Alkalihalobacillus alcalophilus]THG90681.1 hypothetical protein AJ85_09380 [Alkalihalobacillus alcalophilus ATCC 27647 = CGMCC 1.3604]
MPKFLLRHLSGYHVIGLFIFTGLLVGIVTFYNWKLGLITFILLVGLLIYAWQAKDAFIKDMEEYVSTLSYRVQKAGEEAVLNLPVGMLLYNEHLKIQWMNPFVSSIIHKETIGEDLQEVHEKLVEMIEENLEEEIISINSSFYHVQLKQDERLFYFIDVTEVEETKKLFVNTQTVVAFLLLDNYDDVTQGLEEQVRSKLVSQITQAVNNWGQEYDIFLRRTSSDRFIAIMNHRVLTKIEQNKFELIDQVREISGKEKVPLTLSIGIGTGDTSIRELGQLAQSSLDLALGRGGDQVAIKQKNGKFRFYGGKSNAVEKRTRVRARVISHALRDFVLDSDQVMVMGHKNPDMDAIGAAIGVLKIAEVNQKEGYVILDPNDVNHDVGRLMEEIEVHDHLWSQFITPEEALEEISEKTLLVIVDTHKPSMVIEEKLLERVERIVVLDHHRRGEEFINDPVLVYMEPYASSTAELVTELLEYQPKKLKLDRLEATALLAGIVVDTKSFSNRTGARTFDAASYLRSNGADTTLVQNLLKEDLDHYVKRAQLVENTEYYRQGYAIAVADENDIFNQVTIAQAADTLLTMKGVDASFVISNRTDGCVSISARSLGSVNVQLIMEHLGGGGHLTNAATQIENVTIEEAKVKLQEVIDETLEGGN